MDIVNIFNSALPCNFTNLYQNYPENKFYDMRFILQNKSKIKIFNNIANVIFFLEKNCTFDNTISTENLLKSIGELKLLMHGNIYPFSLCNQIDSDRYCCNKALIDYGQCNNNSNTINIRYCYYLELIYVLLLKFKTECCNMDYDINIIDLHSHFLAWSLYFTNIFKLYPNLKIVSSYNLFLDDIVE